MAQQQDKCSWSLFPGLWTSSLSVLGLLVRGRWEMVSWPFPCQNKFDLKPQDNLVRTLATLHHVFVMQSPPWLAPCQGSGEPQLRWCSAWKSISLLYVLLLQIKIPDAKCFSLLEKRLKIHSSFCPVRVLFHSVNDHCNYAVFSCIHQVEIAYINPAAET